MKKLLSVLLAVSLLATVCVSFMGCTPREEKLIIYNWGEYMPKDVYKGFESWYKEKTQKNVKVVYNTFETPEDVHKKLENGGDYDLVCPSDYMVERMIREEMLQPLSVETRQVLLDRIDPRVIDMAQSSYDKDFKYSMPFIWGTFGIMYNSKAAGQNDEKMSTWGALWDESMGKTEKVYMKDSVRDSYTVAMLYKNSADLLKYGKGGSEENLEKYNELLDSVFNSISTTSLAEAKKVLIDQKRARLIKDYSVDFDKVEMQNDTNGDMGYYGMFWSCDPGYILNEEGGSNFNVRYVVPKEGSNVWIDNFVIPKNAINTEAANMFIQYLCETDIAYDCMDEVGSSSAVIEAVEQYKKDLAEDEDGFFDGKPEGFEEMYMEMMFPSDETLARCRIMKDFGVLNEALVSMWEEVRQA